MVYSLGNLNWEIYQSITDRYVTNEVVITEEQLRHIKKRHQEAYQDVLHYLKETLDSPDYIFKDSHPDTGLVIKEIRREAMIFLLVLKIATSSGKSGYKNSVISGWRITEKRLKNYLRNKKLIYKKE